MSRLARGLMALMFVAALTTAATSQSVVGKGQFVDPKGREGEVRLNVRIRKDGTARGHYSLSLFHPTELQGYNFTLKVDMALIHPDGPYATFSGLVVKSVNIPWVPGLTRAQVSFWNDGRLWFISDRGGSFFESKVPELPWGKLPVLHRCHRKPRSR